VHGLFRKDRVDQQGRNFSHAPRPANGTGAATFATEGHQVLGVAVVALHAQETVFQAAVFNPHFSPRGVRY